jgi:Carboxypeptidase regulatory-like domain/TonB dependent receptor
MMALKSIMSVLAALVFSLMWSGLLSAQFTTASLNGNVVDPSGAAVPGAKVSVTNTGTGFESTATSGETGLFVFPRLPVGSYTLRVEKEGFSTYVQEGIVLTVNQSATQNVSLRVGEVTENVVVNADVDLVTTGTATVGQLVDARRVVDLPLNGRRAQSLLYLGPGTVDVDQVRSLGYGGIYPGEQLANVNGTGLGQVNYQLDGAGHNDTYLNLNLPFPNPDSIQEFNLQADNLSAQYGNAAGGIVNIATRSGTNEIHGSVFEFLRNGALNARNFFAPTHDSLKRNQFGGSIGGPIKKDKLFYFGTFQGTRIRTAPEGQIAFVPTEAQRRGDFSSLDVQLVDPLNGQPFPNNKIPDSRLSPVAKNLLRGIPLPNGPGQQLTYTGRSGDQNENQFMIKGDYNTGRNQLNGRYFFSDFDAPGTFSAENLLAASNDIHGVRVQNVAINHTFTARPTLLINTWFGWNQQRGGHFPNATFGFPDVGSTISAPSDPQLAFSVDGYFSVTTSERGDFDRGDWTVREDVSWIKHSHELHFGAEVVRVKNHLDNTYLQSGNFTFGNQLSGDNLADYMLGLASDFIQGGGEFKLMRGTRLGFFAQDNWRVNPNLTLNLGLRWDPSLPYVEVEQRITCFQPGAKSLRYPNAPVGLVYGGDTPDPGCPSAGYNSNLRNFAPRIGFAYRLTNDGKTSLRGGGGFYYTPVFSALVYMYFDPPFQPSYEFNDVSLDDPWGSIGIPSPFPVQYGSNVPGPEATFVTPVSLYYMQKDFRIPQIATWNLTLERQIGTSWVVRAAYVGNKGTRISGSDDYNPAQEANPAIYIPGASTFDNTQERRRFQDFSTVGAIVSAHNSHYHSGQLTVEKRFGQGLSLLASHTWAKSIDDAGWTNPFDRTFDHGRAREDVAHNFKLSSIYEIPRLHLTGVAGAILNGWGITSNVAWRGGFPFPLRSGRDNSFSGVGRDRPDFIGTDIHAAQLSSDRPHGEMVSEFFDTSLFVQNAEGTFGNTGRNVLRGPKFFNTDLGLLKTTRITERTALQFRAEFFNVFNNVNFQLPNGRLTSAGYGTITAAYDPRIIQFALKLSF